MALKPGDKLKWQESKEGEGWYALELWRFRFGKPSRNCALSSTRPTRSILG